MPAERFIMNKHTPQPSYPEQILILCDVPLTHTADNGYECDDPDCICHLEESWTALQNVPSYTERLRPVEPAVTIAVTAQPGGTYDLVYDPDHGFDRLGVSLEDLRANVGSMVMEVHNRLVQTEVKRYFTLCGNGCSDDCWSAFENGRKNEFDEPYCVAAHVTYDEAYKLVNGHEPPSTVVINDEYCWGSEHAGGWDCPQCHKPQEEWSDTDDRFIEF